MKEFSRKYFFNISLLLIIVLAVFLRFYQLGTNPPSLDWDEASLGYNAYSILKTASDEYGNFLPLSIRSFDDYKPALYAYLDILPVAVFGLNEFAVRLPAAVIGVLAVLVIYFLTKEVLQGWERRRQTIIALFAAFFLAVSPWHLQFSRAAFEGNIGLFFFMGGVLFFLKAQRRGSFLYLSSILFLLSLYSYHSFRLIVPIFLLGLIIIFRERIIKIKKEAVISGMILFLFSLPIWVSFFTSVQGANSRLSTVTSFGSSGALSNSIKQLAYDKERNDYLGQVLHNRRFDYVNRIAKGYLDHFNPDFLFLHGDGGVQHHAFEMGMLYLWDLPFIMIGIYVLLRRRNRNILVLFFLFLIASLPSSITTGTPHPVRAITLVPAFHIFASVGVFFAILKILKIKKVIVSSMFLGLILITFIFNLAYYIHQYYAHTPVEYGYFWQYGYKEALNYAKENEENFDNIIMTYEYDQPYVYYLFYNKIDPLWYQKNWDYNGNGTVDRFKRVIDKYTFRNIEYSKDINNPNTLLIGTPKEIPDDANVIKIIKFPDGNIAFKIVKT